MMLFFKDCGLDPESALFVIAQVTKFGLISAAFVMIYARINPRFDQWLWMMKQRTTEMLRRKRDKVT